MPRRGVVPCHPRSGGSQQHSPILPFAPVFPRRPGDAFQILPTRNMKRRQILSASSVLTGRRVKDGGSPTCSARTDNDTFVRVALPDGIEAVEEASHARVSCRRCQLSQS